MTRRNWSQSAACPTDARRAEQPARWCWEWWAAAARWWCLGSLQNAADLHRSRIHCSCSHLATQPHCIHDNQLVELLSVTINLLTNKKHCNSPTFCITVWQQLGYPILTKCERWLLRHTGGLTARICRFGLRFHVQLALYYSHQIKTGNLTLAICQYDRLTRDLGSFEIRFDLARRQREDALSINCAINCTLLKAVPNVQQFLNFVNS